MKHQRKEDVEYGKTFDGGIYMARFCDVLVDILAQAGATHIYGIVGDSLNPISDAIRRDGRLEFIHVRHEESAAFAAGAEAQLSGRLAVCAGTAGPGNTHLINGLYDANRSYAPVLAIVSHIPSYAINSDYFQETHPERVFVDCSKYCGFVANPEQMPKILQEAIQTALVEGGVAVVIIPGDYGLSEIAQSRLGLRHAPLLPQTDIVAQTSEINTLADRINSTEKITLFCGAGCADARTEVLELAEKINAPIAYTMRGKQYLGIENPFDVGMTGLIGWGGATDAMRNCGLLIMLGCDFPYTSWIPLNPYIAQIDIRARNLGKRTRTDFALCGDISKTLKLLNPLVSKKTGREHLDTALAETKRDRDRLDVWLKNVSCGSRPHPEYAEFLIDKYAASDAVFTVPTGLGTVWAARYLTPKKGRNIIGSFTHGSMADEIPMAIGAQFAYPKRQVVALCGDGGFTMLMGEILTVAQYNLPIKMFVFNNSTLGFIDLEMMAEGFIPFETSLKNPNFAEIAKVVGFRGVRVEDSCPLENAVKEAFQTEGPVLVDIVSDPNAIVLPPKISLSQMGNFSIALGKLAFSGRMRDIMNMWHSNNDMI